MAMRVSQRSMFTAFVSNMNTSLSNLMESNIQSSSQKRINRPSDDSVGAARVLNYRDSLAGIAQYKENIDSAKSFLNLADQTLTQANTILTRIKGLAEQGATGTYDGTNREQISFELRQQFEQLINLANTELEGRHIFAGHKTDEQAFVQRLNLTSNDPAIAEGTFTVEGAATKTHLVQFTESGTIGGGADIDYRYSLDAGSTWQNGTLTAGDTDINIGGVQIGLQNGLAVSAVDTTNDHEFIDGDTTAPNGTWLYVRPAAEYRGDDSDAPPSVRQFGDAAVTASASGVFNNEVLVQIDGPTPPTLGSVIEYSYSTDNGASWVTGNTVDSTGDANNASLLIPGGFLNLSSNGGNTLLEGGQFVISPRQGDINFDIGPGEEVAVNNIGKDVFGGLYKEPGATQATAVNSGDGRNMFEVLGRLIGYMETNNQSGIQRALEELDTSSEVILTKAADVGGRENRLAVADSVLTTIQLDEKARMSNIEDVDVAELMTKMAQQQLVYQSVLKSSSQIMQMNLTNFI